MKVYSIYKPPKDKLIPTELRTLLDASIPTIVAGDLNSKHTHWNSKRVCPNGRLLMNDSIDHAYEIIGPDTWTHYEPNGNGDVLDIVVYRGLRALPELDVLADLPSDHRPVLLTLTEIPSRVAAPIRRRKICWDSFQREAQKTTSTIKVDTPENVELATEEITKAIQNSLEIASRTALPVKRTDTLPTWLRKLILEKREKRKLWQQTRCPRLKTELNTMVERVKAALENNAANRWEKHIDSISESIPSAHRLCKQLAGSHRPVQPLMGSDGLLKFEAKERADILAESLERQFTPFPTSDQEHVDTIEKAVKDYLDAPQASSDTSPQKIIFFSPGRVQRVIQRLPKRKAPGIDNIPSEALQHLPPKSVTALTRIYNGILRTGHFPSSWKVGKVVMIPKPGKDARQPDSYRPIALLSTLSKLFEKLLLPHLMPNIKPREEQFGFRAEHHHPTDC